MSSTLCPKSSWRLKPQHRNQPVVHIQKSALTVDPPDQLGAMVEAVVGQVRAFVFEGKAAQRNPLGKQNQVDPGDEAERRLDGSGRGRRRIPTGQCDQGNDADDHQPGTEEAGEEANQVQLHFFCSQLWIICHCCQIEGRRIGWPYGTFSFSDRYTASKAAEITVTRSLGVKPGERVLIITNPESDVSEISQCLYIGSKWPGASRT